MVKSFQNRNPILYGRTIILYEGSGERIGPYPRTQPYSPTGSDLLRVIDPDQHFGIIMQDQHKRSKLYKEEVREGRGKGLGPHTWYEPPSL